MDALSGFLDGTRAREAFLLRSLLDPPWSLRIRDEAPLTVVAMVRGRCWVCYDDAPPVAVEPGGVAVVRGPDHYTVADDPERRDAIRGGHRVQMAGPRKQCNLAEGTDVAAR